MKIGEDLYMWIKIARRYKVCFFAQAAGKLFEGGLEPFVGHLQPERRATHSRSFTTRRRQTDTTSSWPAQPWEKRSSSAQRGHEGMRRGRSGSSATRRPPRTLRKVRILNAPPQLAGPLIGLYNSLAWRIARKGL